MKHWPTKEAVQSRRINQRGFTIIELMVAIGVLGILLAVGIPSFTETMRANNVTAQNNELVTALNFARSEAVRSANPVSLCASADGVTCSASTNWSTGWVVFRDPNNNGVFDGGEALLQVWGAVTGGLALNSTSRTFVMYSATGASAGGAETFSLQKNGCVGNKGRRVSVSTTGRISTAVVACI